MPRRNGIRQRHLPHEVQQAVAGFLIDASNRNWDSASPHLRPQGPNITRSPVVTANGATFAEYPDRPGEYTPIFSTITDDGAPLGQVVDDDGNAIFVYTIDGCGDDLNSGYAALFWWRNRAGQYFCLSHGLGVARFRLGDDPRPAIESDFNGSFDTLIDSMD